MKKDPKKKKLKLKNNIINNLRFIVFILTVSVALLIASSKITETLYFSYNESSEIDYLVYLKENDYYESKFLTKGMQYIASSIDYMDVTFNYDFKTNDVFKYKYNYYINANIKVFEKR